MNLINVIVFGVNNIFRVFVFFWRRNNGKVKNITTMLKIMPFIQILYVEHESSILRCFCRLKFKKRLFNNTFLSFIFLVRWSSCSWKGPNNLFCCCHKLKSKTIVKCITIWTTTASDRIHHLNIRKRKPCKTFNILNI